MKVFQRVYDTFDAPFARGSEGEEVPDLHVRVHHNEVQISVDASGDLLYKYPLIFTLIHS